MGNTFIGSERLSLPLMMAHYVLVLDLITPVSPARGRGRAFSTDDPTHRSVGTDSDLVHTKESETPKISRGDDLTAYEEPFRAPPAPASTTGVSSAYMERSSQRRGNTPLLRTMRPRNTKLPASVMCSRATHALFRVSQFCRLEADNCEIRWPNVPRCDARPGNPYPGERPWWTSRRCHRPSPLFRRYPSP